MKVKTRQSLIHGMGIFATESIPRGEVILRMNDSHIVDDAHPLQKDLGDENYCDYLPDGTTILMCEPERYINHSCDPNAFIYSVTRLRFVLALRNIATGEEIVYDYSINAHNGDVWTCCCGANNCRGRHKCDFFALPEYRQLGYLPFLDPWFAQIHADRIRDLLNRQID